MIEVDQAELEALRAENEMLRAHIASAEAECKILHGLVDARAHERTGATTRGVVVKRTEIVTRERMAMLEHTVDVLDGLAQGLAQLDCYNGEAEDCSCEVCRATSALATVKAWRYNGSTEIPTRRFVGAMHARTENGYDPRETKLHCAWASFMTGYHANPDRCLALVLTDRAISGTGLFEGPLDWPTPRDWYVATSVVQWLGTTVGGSILEKAGWTYTQQDEDTAARATRIAQRSAE